ncbi:helix-turn-helix domain-containing protein, partial [Bosea sp. Tri-44]|uniref:helix-turn-helix domain-containing protein n=1 Tax=Bosea sp. Tri-44 TaxID=1972137 RepID=UPI0020BF561F
MRQSFNDQNRSLERGVAILRAFRPGVSELGNAEIAERTGLAKATVSRLTQTLLGVGMLERHPSRRSYRPAPAVLSFPHALRLGPPLLPALAPPMPQEPPRPAAHVLVA